MRVFLQIGGNNIRKNTTYVDVFKGIWSVVDRLIAGGVQHIIISSIFYRGKPRGITSDEYNSKADQLNRFLHHYFQDSKKVNFWQIPGLMRRKKNIFIVEGVHLNEDAMIKYAAQVRMAVKCESGIKHHKTIKYTVMCYNDDLILFLSFFSVVYLDETNQVPRSADIQSDMD